MCTQQHFILISDRIQYISTTAEELFYHGARLAALGRHAEAAAAYTRSLHIDPTSHVAAENLGIAYSDAGRRQEAIASFANAVKLAPQRAEAYSLLARGEFEVGARESGKIHFEAALALNPASASLHYEIARTDQLFGHGIQAHGHFASAQRLAYSQWREHMGCKRPEAGVAIGGPTHWSREIDRAGSAVFRVNTIHASTGERYGRHAPRPFASRSWPENAGLRWPSLLFTDAPIVFVELHDVYVSGNDGVVTDAQCNMYLPSHGFEVPLHLNLPDETPSARRSDTSIRRVGFDDADADVAVVSLVQLFAANFYSFLADSLARLVVALDAVPGDRRLRIALPADRSKLKPWMWALLERVGVGKHNSFPYDVRRYDGGGLRRAKAVRLHASTLLLVDWQDGDTHHASEVLKRNDLAHLPARAALRLLRERLAFPGAHLAWASPAQVRVVYLQRAAAATRRIANEPALLSALAQTVAHAPPAELHILSDAASLPLADVARMLSRAIAVVGVHGAGWANLVFVGPSNAHAIELGLPEPHAIYTAHAAYCLGLEYHLVPLRGVALHSGGPLEAPVKAVASAARRALRQSGLWREQEVRDGAASPPSVELVVARYDEDASWCDAYNCTVYNKGEDSPTLRARRAAARWRTLPNIGRESHTILSHIVERYDELADWTVFMQGDPWDHMPPGISIETYINASREPTHRGAFFLLTGVAATSLHALAFRTGYAPFEPFTGTLVGPPGGWEHRNRARVQALRQPLGLWSGDAEADVLSPPGAFVNLSGVAVPYKRIDAGLPALQCPLHWIEERQHDRQGLRRFWRRFMESEAPSRLYHAQGAQFAVSAQAIRRRPRSFYRAMLAELRSRDPVSSYYMELVWWYVFDDSGEAAMAAQW